MMEGLIKPYLNQFLNSLDDEKVDNIILEVKSIINEIEEGENTNDEESKE